MGRITSLETLNAQICYNAIVQGHSGHCGLPGEHWGFSGVAWQALAAHPISFQSGAGKLEGTREAQPWASPWGWAESGTGWLVCGLGYRSGPVRITRDAVMPVACPWCAGRALGKRNVLTSWGTHGCAPATGQGYVWKIRLNKTALGCGTEIFGGFDSCSFDTELLLQGVDWLPRALTTILSCFRKQMWHSKLRDVQIPCAFIVGGKQMYVENKNPPMVNTLCFDTTICHSFDSSISIEE